MSVYSHNGFGLSDPFLVPWWYRTQFTTPGSGTGLVRLQFKGTHYYVCMYTTLCGKEVALTVVCFCFLLLLWWLLSNQG